MRDILKVLMILSMLASIGSFFIAAQELHNGHQQATEHPSVKPRKDNRNDMKIIIEGCSRESAKEFCVVVIAVCGAGLAVSRIFS